MSQKITAIYTDDTRPRKYISTLSRRDGMIDNNYVAMLTDDPNFAHDFKSPEEARRIIPRIHNPFDRSYREIIVQMSSKRNLAFVKTEMD